MNYDYDSLKLTKEGKISQKIMKYCFLFDFLFKPPFCFSNVPR